MRIFRYEREYSPGANFEEEEFDVLRDAETSEPADSDTYVLHSDALAAALAERAVCAEIVRAAGCCCIHLGGYEVKGGSGDDWQEVLRHSPRCPIALAAAIEARDAHITLQEPSAGATEAPEEPSGKNISPPVSSAGTEG